MVGSSEQRNAAHTSVSAAQNTVHTAQCNFTCNMDFQEGATLATQSILGPALCNEGSLCIANSEAVGGGATNAGAVFRGIDGGIKVPAQWVGGKGLACTVVGNTHGAILARQQRWLLVGDHSHTSWCGLWLVVNHWVSVHVQVIGVSEARRVPHKLGVSQATGAQTTTAQQGVAPGVCEEPLQAQQHAAAVVTLSAASARRCHCCVEPPSCLWGLHGTLETRTHCHSM